MFQGWPHCRPIVSLQPISMRKQFILPPAVFTLCLTAGFGQHHCRSPWEKQGCLSLNGSADTRLTGKSSSNELLIPDSSELMMFFGYHCYSCHKGTEWKRYSAITLAITSLAKVCCTSKHRIRIIRFKDSISILVRSCHSHHIVFAFHDFKRM